MVFYSNLQFTDLPWFSDSCHYRVFSVWHLCWTQGHQSESVWWSDWSYISAAVARHCGPRPSRVEWDISLCSGCSGQVNTCCTRKAEVKLLPQTCLLFSSPSLRQEQSSTDSWETLFHRLTEVRVKIRGHCGSTSWAKSWFEMSYLFIMY